tara:strand:- start:8086 stop:8286 length:201 start_codon:yes stop_codon:yes gene_type:complete
MDILTRRSQEAVKGERFVFQSERSQSGHIIEKAGKGSFWHCITERAVLCGTEKGLRFSKELSSFTM